MFETTNQLALPDQRALYLASLRWECLSDWVSGWWLTYPSENYESQLG